MTKKHRGRWHSWIIPYQELLGNYDLTLVTDNLRTIIPYQELLGNYDVCMSCPWFGYIIPYQELLGNYDYGYATH